MDKEEFRQRAAIAALPECISKVEHPIGIVDMGEYDRLVSEMTNHAASMAVRYADALMERLEDKKWSLSDARDGDILVSRNGNPFIYNGYRDEHWVGAYCGIDTAGYFLISESQNYWTSSEGVSLASGTDVNILFRKMYEDGYIWIPGKKEIKKIKEYKK